ncbi:MAG: Tfp pilus assembly protein FimT/FimU [Syntrophales bacterium]
MKNNGGYTLIELAVVLLLIGVTLVVTVPRVRDTFSSDRLKAAARQLIGNGREMRNDAVREQVDYVLLLDIDHGRFWKYSTAMTPEMMEEMKKKAVDFPSGVKIADVYLYGQEKISTGEVALKFYRKGYVQPAVVHLAYSDRYMTLVFNPFLGSIKAFDEYIDVWQKETGTYPAGDIKKGFS